MNRRGFLASTALHVAAFVFFLVGPRPPEFHFEPAPAIAVDLVPSKAPEPPKLRAPRQEPERTVVPEKAPVTEIQETPELTPDDPEPEPVKPTPVTPTKKSPPPRKLQKVAPRRDEDTGPSLEERLRSRLSENQPTSTSPPSPADAKDTPEDDAPAEPSSAAEVQAVDFPFAWYLNVIRTRATDAWDPPGDRLVVGRTNQVLVHLRIHRDGRVTDVRAQNSGNSALDASAVRAVKAAEPFPPLPEAWEEEVLDVTIRFTAEPGS
ncbi:MAG: TonB family protein [bacterium]